MSRTYHFKGFSVVRNGVKIRVDMQRFSKQFYDAQFWLDRQIMTDMVPYMPLRTGTFIRITRAGSTARAGTGRVLAAAPPMGRMLYMGKVMVDPVTGSPWARKGARKVVTARRLDLSQASNPKAVPHWFDAAKAARGKGWVAGVKERAGGG